MARTTPKTDIDGAFEANSGASHARRRPAHHAAAGSPALSIAAVALGAIGLVCGFFVSWIACIIAGIAAVVCGVKARRSSGWMRLAATAGIVLGAVCIVASIALVALFYFQLVQLGLA